jgi:hypothetical protein
MVRPSWLAPPVRRRPFSDRQSINHGGNLLGVIGPPDVPTTGLTSGVREILDAGGLPFMVGTIGAAVVRRDRERVSHD